MSKRTPTVDYFSIKPFLHVHKSYLFAFEISLLDLKKDWNFLSHTALLGENFKTLFLIQLYMNQLRPEELIKAEL